MNGRPSSGSSTQTTTAVKWPLCIIFNVFITSTPRHCSRTHLNGSHFAHTRHATVYVHFRTAARYTHGNSYERPSVCVCDMKTFEVKRLEEIKPTTKDKPLLNCIIAIGMELRAVATAQYSMHSARCRLIPTYYISDFASTESQCAEAAAILCFITFFTPNSPFATLEALFAARIWWVCAAVEWIMS